MKNTIKWFGIVVMTAIIAFSMTACGEGTKTTKYYYYEFFTITKIDFDSVPVPDATFTGIKSFRNALRDKMDDFVASGTDATKDDIYDLLTQRGMAHAEANDCISFLNSVGNNLVWFHHVTDTTLWVIVYIEKI